MGNQLDNEVYPSKLAMPTVDVQYGAATTGHYRPKAEISWCDLLENRNNMNKKFLISAPIGAGVGRAVYSGLMNGFSHLDYYKIITAMIVAFVIALPIVFFSRPKI